MFCPATYVPNGDYFVSMELQWTNRKFCKTFALHQREIFNNFGNFLVPPRMCRMVIILCLWNFNEQIENSVKFLLYTSENFFKISGIFWSRHVCTDWWLFCVYGTSMNKQKIFVRFLLYTSENFSRKFHAWLHFVPSQ